MKYSYAFPIPEDFDYPSTVETYPDFDDMNTARLVGVYPKMALPVLSGQEIMPGVFVKLAECHYDNELAIISIGSETVPFACTMMFTSEHELSWAYVPNQMVDYNSKPNSNKITLYLIATPKESGDEKLP